jgi:hypothetical protein
LPSGFDIIGSDVTSAIAGWCVAVLRNYKGLLSGIIQHGRLISRIDRADGDAVDTLCQQIIYNASLLGGSSVGGDSKFDFDTGNFFRRFFGTFASNSPEVRSIVGDESKFVLATRVSTAGFWFA